MDFTLITNFLYNALYYLVPLVILIAVLKRASFICLFSEFKINLLLKLFFPKNEYHIIKDVRLLSESGVTKIDYVLVSIYGVFVIETNNMKGRIFGSANQNKWTRKIARNSNKFTNPILQSHKKNQVFADFLNVNLRSLYSVVVFIGSSTFKTKMPENVTHIGGIVKFIRSKKIEVFTKNEILIIIRKVESCKVNKEVITNKGKVVHVKQRLS